VTPGAPARAALRRARSARSRGPRAESGGESREKGDDMRPKRLLIVGSMVLGLAGVGLAQAPPAAPKPGPEHKKLGYFVGNWTSEGEVKASPFGPGGKFTSMDKCEWFEGGFAVVCHSTGKGPTGAMTAIGIMGYSPDLKAYTYYGVSNDGMTMTSIPRGTVQGQTWTYDDESIVGGQKMKSRYVMQEISPSSYTFKWEAQGPDGKWSPIMEGTAKKGT
jgi:hypothetical protein